MAIFARNPDFVAREQQSAPPNSLISIPGEGGTLIFSYIRRFGPFLGLTILNFIFGVFQKK